MHYIPPPYNNYNDETEPKPAPKTNGIELRATKVVLLFSFFSFLSVFVDPGVWPALLGILWLELNRGEGVEWKQQKKLTKESFLVSVRRRRRDGSPATAPEIPLAAILLVGEDEEDRREEGTFSERKRSKREKEREKWGRKPFPPFLYSLMNPAGSPEPNRPVFLSLRPSAPLAPLWGPIPFFASYTPQACYLHPLHASLFFFYYYFLCISLPLNIISQHLTYFMLFLALVITIAYFVA